jgi:hypothetical protein
MKIQLDKTNGDVIIGDLKITYTFSISDIENLKDRYEVKFVRKTNNGNVFYQISSLDNGECAALFMFKNEKMDHMDIAAGINYPFPPYIITDEERKIIQEKILSLGGEHIYPWGSVFYNEDNKGGSVSLTIKYDRNK